jgi:hypothetical protein
MLDVQNRKQELHPDKARGKIQQEITSNDTCSIKFKRKTSGNVKLVFIFIGFVRIMAIRAEEIHEFVHAQLIALDLVAAECRSRDLALLFL